MQKYPKRQAHFFFPYDNRTNDFHAIGIVFVRGKTKNKHTHYQDYAWSETKYITIQYNITSEVVFCVMKYFITSVTLLVFNFNFACQKKQMTIYLIF